MIMDTFVMLCMDAAVELAWLCDADINKCLDRGKTQTTVQDAIRTFAYHFVEDYVSRDEESEATWDSLIELEAESLSDILRRL